MERIWTQPGRPTASESSQRTHELLRHLVQGKPLADAARLAHVKPERVLRLMGEPEFFQAYTAIVDEAKAA